MDDYLASCEAGQPLAADDLATRYPELAEQVADCLASLDFIRRAAGGSASDLRPLTSDLRPSTSDLRPPTSDSPSGDAGTLGDFRILREIGRGGMGVVYEAEQISLQRRVALKVLPFAAVLDSKQLARFKNEALAAASLDHPHIVDVLGVGCDRGMHFYAMRLIDGCTLADVIAELRSEGTGDRDQGTGAVGNALRGVPGEGEARQGDAREGEAREGVAPAEPSAPDTPHSAFRTPHLASTTRAVLTTLGITDTSRRTPDFYRKIAALIADAADALHHAHEQGVIHRDIKPSNLMLDNRGKLWVTDFGLAHVESNATLTMTGDLMGTLRYMSPEQASGSRLGIDHRTDIYSLGVTLYELLTLHPAFTGENRADLLRQITSVEPRAPRQYEATLPVELQSIVLKSIERESVDRYATAVELADDLRRFLDNKPIRARRPGGLQVLRKWASRHAPVVTLTAFASLLLAATLAIGTGLLLQERGYTQAAMKTAQDNLQEAKAQKRKAEKLADKVRLRLYAADMRLAFQTWNSADLRQTVQLLSHYLPTDGQQDIRGFEWHYLWRLCHDERLELAGHKGEVYWVAWSPDGMRLVTSGEDETAKVWDTATGHELFTLSGHTGAVRSAIYAPSGELIATASDDKSIKLWDAATGRLAATLTGHTRELRCVAFSPDDKYLASGSLDDMAQLWDVESRQVRSVFQGHLRGVRGVSFSPDGKTLATAAGDHEIKLWDLSTFDERKTLSGHITWLTGVAFSPDGETLASCCWGPMVKVWDVPTLRERYEVAEHTNWVQSIAFSPDGDALLTASRDTTARTFDVATGKATRVLRAHPSVVWCAAFSPDGQTIATAGADGFVKLWGSEAQTPFVPLPLDWPRMRDSVGGLAMLSASVSRSGRRLAYFTSQDRALRILDLLTGTTETTLFGNSDDRAFTCMEISPDGRLAASGTRAGLVQLWDLPNGNERLTIPAHPYYVHSLAFSPNGQLLASGDIGMGLGEDYHASVRVWEVPNGKQRCELPFQGSGVRDLAFSPDGDFLAATADDQGKAPIWRLTDGERHCELAGHTEPMGALRFSPDGKLIATGADDRTVRLWDAATGELRSTMRGHGDNITSLAFSPDGRTLVSGSHDRTIRLWHVATGQELGVLEGHQTAGCFVAFCLDGRALASFGLEELFLWPTIGATGPGSLEH